MFELLYWIIDSSRINFSNKLFINKNELKRIESCLETHGFIEPVDKEKHEPLSYVYKSKYTEFIRFYRDKLVTRRLPSDRYNKNLNEYTLDRLYGSVKDIDFNDIVLGNLEYYRVSLLISLASIILYRNETEYPNLFLPEVYKEIIRTLERNGLNNYKISAYIDGLKKYYYLQSMKVNKKLADKKR